MHAKAWIGAGLVFCTGCGCQPPPKGADDEVYISGGSFTMGHDALPMRASCIGSTEPCNGPPCPGQWYTCNTFAPKHRVTLDPYFIDKLEVTNAQYRACIEAGVCALPGLFARSTTDSKVRYPDPEFADYPIYSVEWPEAQRYCQWRGRRLPTEAEWERAARGNSEREYPWGNKPATCEQLPEACEPVKETGWVSDRMRPVGTTPYDATPEGVLDLAGNASELVADAYEPEYYQTSPEKNPTGPAVHPKLPPDTGQNRVARGLWFDQTPLDWPADRTVPMWARTRSTVVDGFRCARSVAQAGVIPKYRAIAWRPLR